MLYHYTFYACHCFSSSSAQALRYLRAFKHSLHIFSAFTLDESINSLVSYVRRHDHYNLLSIAEVNSGSNRHFDPLRWLAGATFGPSL